MSNFSEMISNSTSLGVRKNFKPLKYKNSLKIAHKFEKSNFLQKFNPILDRVQDTPIMDGGGGGGEQKCPSQFNSTI